MKNLLPLTHQAISPGNLQYIGFSGKRLGDITGDGSTLLLWCHEGRRDTKMSVIQTRLHYLSGFCFLITEELVHSNPVKEVR